MGLRLTQICLCLTFLFYSFVSYAQTDKKSGIVKGKLINAATKAPFADVKVSIPDLNTFTTTDGDGVFVLSEVPYGAHSVVISGYNIQGDTITVTVSDKIADIGSKEERPNDLGASPESQEIPTIALEDNNNDINSTTGQQNNEEGVTTQNVSGLIFANKDPFVYTLAYIFGSYHVQARGYARNQDETQVNGIPINDLETGNASWSQLGGLNDVFYGRDITYGLAPSPYTFGGVTGSIYVDATAADQRRGTKITYTLADRNYRNRLMLTHSSGLMKNGWAYSVSLSRRWATEGYVPGTYYDGYSFYAAVSKVIRKSQFDLTVFGAPTERGKDAAETKEADTIAGTKYYNSYWGYQNGKKRDARVQKTFQPQIILDYKYKVSNYTILKLALGYEFGKDQNSSINGLVDHNSRPDYYKYMPSYYSWYSSTASPSLGAYVKQLYQSNPGRYFQVNWDAMYLANGLNDTTVYNADGIKGNNVHGKEAIYWLGSSVNDLHKWTFNSNVQHVVNEHINIDGGLRATFQQDEYYAVVDDLLGADFVYDVNYYLPQQFPQTSQYLSNNLREPNHIAKVGDKYASDYYIKTTDGQLWGQSIFTYDMVDFFVAANAGYNSFYRDGLWQNAVYPNNSYGNSPSNSFFTYGLKGGATLKIDSRNIFFANASYAALPPTVSNTYISADSRDFTVDNPHVSHTGSLEAGYLLKASNLNARVVGYVTDDKDQTIIKHFYDDDPSVGTFVNMVMQNVSTRFIGTEILLDYKVIPSLSITGVASIGQAFYTNNPSVSLSKDDDTSRAVIKSQSFLKNYYLAVGPQSAYTLGFNYHPSRKWYADINLNYLDRSYVDVSPIRRTALVASDLNSQGYTSGSAVWSQVFDQEELPSAITVDVRAGINFDLSRPLHGLKRYAHRPVLNLQGSINNLLNNTNIVSSGFEQLRYNYGTANPGEFPNKYYNAYGINFFIQASLRF
jgi:CarboxypepD_reg-like domain